MFETNWANLLNSYDLPDERKIKNIDSAMGTAIADVAHQLDVNSVPYLEKASEELRDLVESTARLSTQLDEERSELAEIAIGLLGLVKAATFDSSEYKAQDIIAWCSENFRGNWECFFYDRQFKYSPSKLYLIVAATDDNDRIHLKLRWS